VRSTSWRALGSVVALLGCRDNAPPEILEEGLPHVAVAYVCGNDFDLQHQNPTALTVQYRVMGTSEVGELLLPASPESGTSSTRLTTFRPGALRVSREDRFVLVENGETACPPSGANQPLVTRGEWAQPFPWPVVAVHLHLLPDGRVLSWGRVGSPQLWDPRTGEFAASPTSTMVFCSGHAFLADGRLLVTGGHKDDYRGIRDAGVYDAATESWLEVQPMSRARWYPTTITLADGDMLTLAGTDETGVHVDLPEVWSGSQWRPLTGARQVLPFYPRVFLAPNGLVFYAGEMQQTAYLDLAGEGSWSPVALSNYGRRDYGSAIMYRPGQVLIVGGSDPPDGAPTATAEVVDLNEAMPSWSYTGSMAYARRQFNATLLADGQVLVTGGTSSPGFSDLAGSVRVAEVWNPGTGVWSELAAGQVRRVYHSTSILLPDGRLLYAGSGDGVGLPRELSAELFSPPYLFRGPRPEIASSPAAIAYGERFFVGSEDAGQVLRATLVRLGSVTHGFDQNQRLVELPVQRTAGGLTLTAPSSGRLAPPGHYLLFLLTGAGVPSVAATVRVG
jgi:hypothetical protein